MASKNIFIYVFAALVAVSYILAEEESNLGAVEKEEKDNLQNKALLFLLTTLGIIPQILPGGLGSALEAKAVENQKANHNSMLYLTTAPCNYTPETRFTCTSCSQAVWCLPSDIAIVRNCNTLNLICYKGHCSSRKDTNCTTAP